MNDSHLMPNVVFAESSANGYSNVLNFSARSKVTESTTTRTSHKPMDLLLIVDISGSLSDLMRNEAGYNGPSIRKWQINSMLSLVQNVVDDNDRISMAFYGGNLEDSYNIGRGPRGRITRLMTKSEVISTLRNLLANPHLYDRKDGDVVLWNIDLPDYSTEDGKPFEEAFDEMTRDKKLERVRSVLQYTDGWSSGETIDTSFAEWSKANAKTFMTVLNIDGYSGDNSSYDKLVRAGHPNIVKLTGTSGVSQSDIERAFVNTATETIVNTTTTKQRGHVTITPDSDLELTSAELVKPDGSKINLPITNNRVDWTDSLDDGNYKLNYTFSGKPSVERSVRGIVTVDDRKVDEKVNTVKPETVQFETRYENDPSLASGVEKEKQPGRQGLRYIITRDGNVVSTINERQKQDRIVLRGTKGSDREVTTQRIPFETKYVDDPNLEVGKTRVVTQGVEGEKEITKTYVTQSGTRVGEPTVSERTITAKVDKVIARGTRGSDREVTTQRIPFETKYVDDSNLEVGKTRVVTEGVVGEKEITKTYVTQSGKRVGDPTVSERTITAKVDKVVARGTRGSDIDSVTNDIPFKVIYKEDKNLEHGKQRVDVEGVVGRLKTTKTYVTQSGKRVGDPTIVNEIVTTKVDKVIAVGTKPVVTTKELEFKTKYVEDKELEAKKQETRTEGKNGLETTTRTYSFNAETGEVTENEPKVETVEAVDKVIAVGTKSVITTKELEFKTTYIEDKELEAKKQEVRTEGVKGTETTTQTYSFNAETGEVTENEPKVETVEAVDKVIAVGTKPVITTKDLDYKTKYVENKELEAKKKVVKTEGKKGSETATQTYSFNSETGEVAANEPTIEKTDAIDEVIEVGTKPVVTTKELEFKTKYVENKELEAKKKVTKTKGSKGLETTTQAYSFNAETGEVTDNKPKVETNAATDELIEVGTKPVVTTKELDYKTKYVEDKTLEAKKKEIRTDGKKGLETTTQAYSFNAETGEVTDNEPKVETVEAVDEVIAVGTKPVVTTKELEFKTERRENKNMKKGEEKVVREGVVGLETTTQTYSFDPETGEVTENEPRIEVKEAIDKLIEYGTREEKKLPVTGGQRMIWLSFAGVGFVLIGLVSLARKLFKK